MVRFFLKRKKLKYRLKYNLLFFRKNLLFKTKKKKWLKLKRSSLDRGQKLFKKNSIRNLILKKNHFNGFLKNNFKENIFLFKLLRNFFIDMGKKKLKKLIFKNQFFYIEKRLKYALVEIFFLESVYSSKQHIKHGRVFVNKIPVLDPDYVLHSKDVVSLKFFGESNLSFIHLSSCWKDFGKKSIDRGFLINFRTLSFSFCLPIKISKSFKFLGLKKKIPFEKRLNFLLKTYSILKLKYI